MSDDRRTPDTKGLAGDGVFVEANGLRHHLLAYGSDSAPPLLILPGITSPAPTWEFIARPLAEEFRVYTLDIRGRGLTDTPAEGYSLPDYAADVHGVIEALGLTRPLILGHSMGARIAAAFAALYPETTGPLLIVDPPLTGPGRDPYSITEETFVRSIQEARAGATAEDMRPYFPTWTDEHLELRAKWLPTCDPNAVAQTHRMFHTEDFFEYWPKITAPVVFIYGGQSPAVTAAGAREAAEALPAAELVEVADAGHMIPWDNLDGFERAAIPSLRRLAELRSA